MNDCFATRTVRGRKEHVCCLCGLRIRRGAKHVVGSGISGGRPFRVRYHEVCLSKTRQWSQDEWESSEFDEAAFRRFELRLPLLPSYARSRPCH